MANIEIDVSGVQKLSAELLLFPRQTNAAFRNAMNRTITRVAKNIAKEAAVEYAIKQGQVKKTIGIKKASLAHLEARADVTDKPIKMGSFQFKHADNRFRSPVRVKIKNKNGFVTSGSSPALFAARSRATGKKEIFHRLPAGNAYKITYGFTLSIPQMVSNEDVYRRIANDADDFFYERFEHELWFQFERLQGRLGI